MINLRHSHIAKTFKKGESPLHKAVLEKDMKRLKEILDSPVGVKWLNRKAKGGWTALHMATKCSDSQFVRLLLEKRADSSITTRHGSSVLHSAACDGTAEVMKMLIEAVDISVNVQTNRGWSPLHYAAQNQKLDVLDLLISSNADLFCKNSEGWLAFHIACKVGHKGCCEALVKAVDNKEQQQQMVVSKTNAGWTPLFCAVNGFKGGHLEIVQWLIEEWRVPVDEPQDKNMFTPLHIATRLGFVSIAECLVEHGASINSTTEDGYTPLHWAALYNQVEMVNFLVEKRAELSVQNRDKNTPIHLAKKRGYDRIYDVIVNAGADISIRNIDGLTPAELTSDFPSEIRSRGAAAIRHFRAALRNGKTKPHRIKLMLLGDARVGKTSLYRYLTGQAFIEDLASTEGIDTKLITTPDVYPVSNRVWKVIDDPQSDFNDKIAQETVRRVIFDDRVDPVDRSHPLIEELPGQDDIHDVGVDSHLMWPESASKLQVSESHLLPPHSTTNVTANPTAARYLGQALSGPLFIPQRIEEHSVLHSRYQGYQQRRTKMSGQQGLHRFHHASTSTAKRHKRQRKSKRKAEPSQHDLSELPMKSFQKHWESSKSGLQEEKAIKFSVWDFAGQQLYEPMHHTFLTRRAIYLIVLNLAKLTDKGISLVDLQRIYFWFASVHAHTPLTPEAVRILFVGTHKNSCSRNRVDSAVKQLCDTFKQSKEFACHIEYIQVDDVDEILARVENSCDDYEDESVCILRDSILKAALDRDYMKEDIPLSWLRYEDEILLYHQQPLPTQGGESVESRCLLTMEEMKAIAVKCGIGDIKEGPFKTMITFFHDVGLILLPSELLGLDESTKKLLEDVALPNPQWLVDLMTILVKIPVQSRQHPSYRADWITLKKEGVLTYRLMHHIMHELHGFSYKDVNTLCILFQALGFICKLLHRQVHTSGNAQHQTEEGNRVTIEDSPDSHIESSQEEDDQCSTERHVERYLVPCQLPEEHLEINELQTKNTFNKRFYFDFTTFLPPWLLFHLIVRLLTYMQQQPDLQYSLQCGQLPLLSKKTCLMAQNSHTRFIIKLTANRIVVCHQLSDSDSNAEKKLMTWLFDMVSEICKQKFKNITFSCGHLCPHVECLKRVVSKESHVDEEYDLRVFHNDEFKRLRKQGFSAVKCFDELRRSAADQNADGIKIPLITTINFVLSTAEHKGHVEEMYSYTDGKDHFEDTVVPCLFSDPDMISSPSSTNEGASLQDLVSAALSQSGLSQQALVSGTSAVSTGTAAAGGITSALQTTERETAIELLPGNSEDLVLKRDINRFAKRLANVTVKFLAAELEVEMDETIKSLSSAREQCFEVLSRWQVKAGKAATIRNLREAVAEAL